jgi:DNA polymerase III epsilon subunit-like protein
MDKIEHKPYFQCMLNCIISNQLNSNIMSYIMVDVETDGPIPGDYSMISFGAVLVNEELDKTFYSELKPISDNYIEEALQVSGFSREKNT